MAVGEVGGYRVEVERCQAAPCPNRTVDVVDLLELLIAWGECECCEEDILGLGVVSVLDLLELLQTWGPSP